MFREGNLLHSKQDYSSVQAMETLLQSRQDYFSVQGMETILHSKEYDSRVHAIHFISIFHTNAF